MQQLTMPLISAEHVEYHVKNQPILQDISFDIQPGQITTIIGPNGAGKSTLVNIVIGLLSPVKGKIKRSSGLRLGYLPQHSRLNASMPINVRRLMSLTRTVKESEVVKALARTGVADLVNQPVNSLSGGEMKRVLLARSLLGKPDLLVLDEPTAGVDITGEAQMYDLIAQIRDEIDCAILLVSHDLHLVMSKTDQVLCLNGHMCCSGKPESVSRHPEYLALFGEQASSIAIYTHHHDHVHELDGACDTCVHKPHEEAH